MYIIIDSHSLIVKTAHQFSLYKSLHRTCFIGNGHSFTFCINVQNVFSFVSQFPLTQILMLAVLSSAVWSCEFHSRSQPSPGGLLDSVYRANKLLGRRSPTLSDLFIRLAASVKNNSTRNRGNRRIWIYSNDLQSDLQSDDLRFDDLHSGDLHSNDPRFNDYEHGAAALAFVQPAGAEDYGREANQISNVMSNHNRDFDVSLKTKRIYGDEIGATNVCINVCGRCERHLGIRWTSMCWKYCDRHGVAFHACLVATTSNTTPQ